MKTLRTIALVLGSMAFSAAFAQTAVAPPPQPAADGPTLAATMQFIQDKLNEIGKISFVSFLQDTNNGNTWTETAVNEFSNAVADSGQCRVSYHRKLIANNTTAIDADFSFSLRDV